MHIFCNVLKEHNDDFVALNVDVYVLGYHSTCKGNATLCVSGFTVEPPNTSICLREGWYMVNVKSCYLQYEVAGDQFCVRVSGLNPVTSDFSVFCCCFETKD